jgi:hypothetical protein
MDGIPQPIVCGLLNAVVFEVLVSRQAVILVDAEFGRRITRRRRPRAEQLPFLTWKGSLTRSPVISAQCGPAARRRPEETNPFR